MVKCVVKGNLRDVGPGNQIELFLRSVNSPNRLESVNMASFPLPRGISPKRIRNRPYLDLGNAFVGFVKHLVVHIINQHNQCPNRIPRRNPKAIPQKPRRYF
jgi:hypothetical protein